MTDDAQPALCDRPGCNNPIRHHGVGLVRGQGVRPVVLHRDRDEAIYPPSLCPSCVASLRDWWTKGFDATS